MSDTTPRPDETPGDPTAPAQPADVEVTEVVPATADAVPAAEEVAAPEPMPEQPAPPMVPPAPQPAYAQAAQPPQDTPQPPQYAQPGYAQPQLPPPPPVHGAAPGTAVAGPNAMSPADERTWGMVAHAGTLAATVLSGGTLGFICALVLYLVNKDRGPFVRHHTANALNVQILGAILVVGGIILTVTVIGAIIGIPMIVLGGLYVLVAHIIGAVKANSGEWWNPPMTPHFVK